MQKSEQPIVRADDNKENVLSQEMEAYGQEMISFDGGVVDQIDDIPSKDDSAECFEENKTVFEQEKDEKALVGDNDETARAFGSEKLGKFKSVDGLLKAYNALEAEFTKKCQKLSEYMADNPDGPSNARSMQTELDEFASRYGAQDYSQELASRVAGQDWDEAKGELYGHLVDILKSKIKTESDMIGDRDFLDRYVYSNPDIRNKIITSYVASLNDATPVQVSLGKNSKVCLTPAIKPASVHEAGIIAQNIIKKH